MSNQASVETGTRPGTLCRISWRSKHTGATGHGEWLSEDVAKLWLNEAIAKHGQDIEHWLEYKE